MTFQDFHRLYIDASECDTAELFMAECGGSADFSSPEDAVRILTAIHTIVHAVVVCLVPQGNVTVAGDYGILAARVGVDVGAGCDGAVKPLAQDDRDLGVIAKYPDAPAGRLRRLR